jgi:acyl transferase domain-containing protein
VYGDAPEGRPWCGIGSVKSMIGHTKAAAGSAGLIKAALALHHKTLPPTIKVREAAPVFKDSKTPFYLLLEKRPWFNSAQHPRRAAVSAFGFGGSNYHAVLEEYETSRHEIDWDGRAEIIALSGTTPAAIRTALAPFTKPLALADLRLQAPTRDTNSSRPSLPARVRDRARKNRSLRLAAAADANLPRRPLPPVCASRRCLVRNRAAAEPIGVVFPGQGAQYLGMGRDLCCLMPETFTPIAAADALWANWLPANARRPGVSTPGARRGRQKDPGRSPESHGNRPASNRRRFNRGLPRLERFGIKPAALIGHSSAS